MHARKFSPIEQVQDDFPQEPWPTAIIASQLQDATRHFDRNFDVGRTSDARLLRYRVCKEVVQLLLPYCRSKLVENSALTTESLLQRIDAGLLIEATDLTLLEQAWCLAQVKEQLCMK
jgi:hypothetical protein